VRFPSSLASSALDFSHSETSDLLRRFDAPHAWCDERLASGYDPYQKSLDSSVATRIKARLRDGTRVTGINLASQDYLSLCNAPEIRAAAIAAIEDEGVHSAGSAALMGLTASSNLLERELADFTGYLDCTLFPIAWAAGYGVITALVRPTDHVVIDVLSHACLQEGARSATTNVHKVPHLKNSGVERRLRKIRESAPQAGILVVTETLFSMDSDSPRLAELQTICNKYSATLLVDCAHDLGAMGATGRGVLEEQGLVGKVDLLMGSFSKVFGSPGGFVCSHSPSLKWGLRYSCGPSTFTNAMSPIQAAVVRSSLRLIRGDEGCARRERLLRNVNRLRSAVSQLGYQVLGRPSAVVPVIVGDVAYGRILTKYLLKRGAIVNLVEYPAVSAKTSRLRLQVMADHTPDDIEEFVAILQAAEVDAQYEYDSFAPPSLEEEEQLAINESMVVPKAPASPHDMDALNDSAVVPKYPRAPTRVWGT
jgi:7-keto-8-aminopelargonate synthetase-like enzyme